MDLMEAREEYGKALKAGQKDFKDLTARGVDPYPQVLDEVVGHGENNGTQDLGVVEIPAERIIGVKSAGRTAAFTRNFLPLLDEESEFAHKWINLCAAHLSDEGIREPAFCFEYLGNFYVQEGNKRISVLRYFGAPRVPSTVRRILPARSDEPRIQAYYEFLDFYKVSASYDVQFRQPGDYAKLLSFLGNSPKEPWSDREKRTYSAYFRFFREAFTAVKGDALDLLPEEALLLWLRVYPFQKLGNLPSDELNKTVAGLWEDMVSISQEEGAEVQTEPETEQKQNILTKLITGTPEHVDVAFIYQRDFQTSAWNIGHKEGAEHLQEVFGDRVTVRSYFHADTPEQAEEVLEEAVASGAQVVFTTTPQLSRPTLKAAVKHPKVRFLNCSVDAPYSSVRTYYSRVYEGKFITGAIAGAMADNDEIGYVGSYPIFGVPASINAFALGAQLTNPRAKVYLRWSCEERDPVGELTRQGIRVISNRDVPTVGAQYLEFGNYGTYFIQDDGSLMPLGSPVWMWGRLYEHVVRSVLQGTWNTGKNVTRAVNYWWGMDSGVIDVELASHLPQGLRTLADQLRKGLQNGTLDPFNRPIYDNKGVLRNPEGGSFSPRQLLHMDWLCDNVVGQIPPFERILPYSQAMVRELGVYRDSIAPEKEGSL